MLGMGVSSERMADVIAWSYDSESVTDHGADPPANPEPEPIAREPIFASRVLVLWPVVANRFDWPTSPPNFFSPVLHAGSAWHSLEPAWFSPNS